VRVVQPQRPAATVEQGLLRAAREALAASRFDGCIDLARPVFYGAREGSDWPLAGDAALLLARAPRAASYASAPIVHHSCRAHSGLIV
jgi:hypothetical protein